MNQILLSITQHPVRALTKSRKEPQSCLIIRTQIPVISDHNSTLAPIKMTFVLLYGVVLLSFLVATLILLFIRIIHLFREHPPSYFV